MSFFLKFCRWNIGRVWYHRIVGIWYVNLCKALWVLPFQIKFHLILQLSRNRHLSHIPNTMTSTSQWIPFNSIWNILAIIANKRTHLWPLHALNFRYGVSIYIFIHSFIHSYISKIVPSSTKLRVWQRNIWISNEEEQK